MHFLYTQFFHFSFHATLLLMNVCIWSMLEFMREHRPRTFIRRKLKLHKMKNKKNYVYKKYIKYSKFQSVLLFHWNISLSANLLFLKSDVGALTCLLTDANTVVLVQQMASSACEIKSLQGTFCANQILQTAGRGPGIKINIYKRLFQNKILLCTFILSSSLI